MVSEAADGWQWVALGKIADIIAGQSPPGSTYNTLGNGLPFFQGKAEFGEIHPRPLKWCTAPQKVAEPGDILISIRAPVGPTNVADVTCAIGRGLAAIRPRPGVTTEYLHYALRASVAALQARATGTTFSAVSAKQLGEHEVPLAPASERDEIVARLERRFSLLGAGQSALTSASRRLRQYRQSCFTAALRPHATPETWQEVELGEVAQVGGGTTPRRNRNDYWDGGTVPWVASGKVNDPVITSPTSWVTPRAVQECRLKLWPVHTLVLAMYGEGKTRGKCSELLIEATTNQACAAIVVNPEAPIRREFLKLFLAAQYHAHRRIAAGGVQPNLSLEIIRRLKVPVPPMTVQDELVSEIERQLSVADEVQESLRTIAKHAKTMHGALLGSALKGSDANSWPR